MTRTVRGLVPFTVGVLAICFAGCQSTTNGAAKPLTVNSQPYVVDVPIPQGFKYVDKKSEDRISGDFRYVRHQYQGRAHPISVRNFFREQMPLSRWTQLNDVNDKGNYRLTFEKQGENCTIDIEPHNVVGFTKTIIRVTISRVDRGAAPPAK